MASDHMVQGDLIPIPLLRAVGYQHQCHTIVHFTNGNPDLGRKVFQPEYQQLAEKLAKGAVQTFIRYRTHLRPDTGTAQMLPDRELQNWMREQVDWRRHEALKVFPMFKGLSLVSNPREEQDVVALFHELAACGVLRGYNFLSATCNDRYDALFELNYEDEAIYFDGDQQPLGVSREIPIPFQSATEVLEFKYDLDGLARDFDKQVKFPNHIGLAVCWKVTVESMAKLELRPLLVDSAGDIRQHYGATHTAYLVGNEQPAFEVVVLQDLVIFLADRPSEVARQKTLYLDTST